MLVSLCHCDQPGERPVAEGRTWTPPLPLCLASTVSSVMSCLINWQMHLLGSVSCRGGLKQGVGDLVDTGPSDAPGDAVGV